MKKFCWFFLFFFRFVEEESYFFVFWRITACMYGFTFFWEEVFECCGWTKKIAPFWTAGNTPLFVLDFFLIFFSLFFPRRIRFPSDRHLETESFRTMSMDESGWWFMMIGWMWMNTGWWFEEKSDFIPFFLWIEIMTMMMMRSAA